MMSSQYETLGWNEQNVLTLPAFRKYLWKSFLRFLSKLLIIIPSAVVISTIPVVLINVPPIVEECVVPFICRLTAVFSMLLSTILMMVDFIIACVISKKIGILINVFTVVICTIMSCLMGVAAPIGLYLNYCDGTIFVFPSIIICIVGWFLSGVVSIIQLIVLCRTR